MRPLWNGTLAFGLVVIPVRLYAATERKSISFRLIHDRCNTPVRYMKWCPHCEKELSPGEILKAYEYQKGERVVVSEEEMEAIPGPDAHAIEILDFVNLSEVDPVYYEKSFFLEPREGAEKAYALLRRSMMDEGKVALARVAIRAKETLAVVRTYLDKFIVMETMFWADEVRAGDELRVPTGAAIDEREKTMARTLIETLSAAFEPDRYRSRQREAVADLIQKKIQGKEIVREPEAAVQVIDLMEALRRSVAQAKGEEEPRKRRKAAGETGPRAGPSPRRSPRSGGARSSPPSPPPPSQSTPSPLPPSQSTPSPPASTPPPAPEER